MPSPGVEVFEAPHDVEWLQFGKVATEWFVHLPKLQDSRENSSPTRQPRSKEEKAQARGGPGKISMILMLADERIYVWSCRKFFFIFSVYSNQ